MTDSMTTASDVYQGWEALLERLNLAISPLTLDQLSCRTAANLRSVNEIARHIIGARARWCRHVLKIGDDPLDALGEWDDKGMPDRSAAELVEGLRASWAALRNALDSWTITDLTYAIPNSQPDPGEPLALSRQWVLWHLIEHDLYHVGEISMILGSHGLSGVGL